MINGQEDPTKRPWIQNSRHIAKQRNFYVDSTAVSIFVHILVALTNTVNSTNITTNIVNSTNITTNIETTALSRFTSFQNLPI